MTSQKPIPHPIGLETPQRWTLTTHLLVIWTRIEWLERAKRRPFTTPKQNQDRLSFIRSNLSNLELNLLRAVGGGSGAGRTTCLARSRGRQKNPRNSASLLSSTRSPSPPPAGSRAHSSSLKAPLRLNSIKSRRTLCESECQGARDSLRECVRVLRQEVRVPPFFLSLSFSLCLALFACVAALH